MTLAPATLEDATVRLEPYAVTDREALRAALDVDPEAWAVLASRGDGAQFDRWWNDAAANASRIAYAVRRLADGRLVGTSSYLEISPAHRRVEIGATFLHPDARAGLVNPAMKRLMLAHAFASGAVRVELVTDVRNLRSQGAIAKLGAMREGVLRRHKVTWSGYVRDTVIYAITDLDWPAVRAGLDARLAAVA